MLFDLSNAQKKEIPMTSQCDVSSQVAFWKGAFGTSYLERNIPNPSALASRTRMWERVLSPISNTLPSSILEVGANIGINLHALAGLTTSNLYAVEPNTQARHELAKSKIVPTEHIFDGIASALPFGDQTIDFVFTSGVLIHVHPEDLLASTAEMYRVSSRYIACIEYFSDKPEEINYRGNKGMLFKRDFGAFWLDNFPNIKLLDYGFFWKRATQIDNLTWWLFEK